MLPQRFPTSRVLHPSESRRLDAGCPGSAGFPSTSPVLTEHRFFHFKNPLSCPGFPASFTRLSLQTNPVWLWFYPYRFFFSVCSLPSIRTSLRQIPTDATFFFCRFVHTSLSRKSGSSLSLPLPRRGSAYSVSSPCSFGASSCLPAARGRAGPGLGFWHLGLRVLGRASDRLGDWQHHAVPERAIPSGRLETSGDVSEPSLLHLSG